MKRNIILIQILLIFTFSCSTVPKNINKEEKSDRPIRKNNLKYLNADASITASVDDKSNYASLEIKIAGIDSISIDISGPMGISIGKLYSTPKYFIFYNYFEDIIYEGEPNSKNFRKLINIPVSFDDLIHLLRGETPEEPENFRIDSTNKTKNSTLFKFSSQNHTSFALFSKSDSCIEQYQRKSSEGKTIIDCVYQNFDNFKGYNLPKKINFKFPSKNISLILNLKNYEINQKPSKPFSLNIPEKVKRVKL